MAQPLPTVTKQEAENFAKIWTHKGLAMPMNDIQIQFATDFANVALTSFVRMCQEQALAAMKAAESARNSTKLVLE